jgi:hypothetical protein
VLDHGAVDDVFVRGLRGLAGGSGSRGLFDQSFQDGLLRRGGLVGVRDLGGSRERRTMMDVFQSLTLEWS